MNRILVFVLVFFSTLSNAQESIFPLVFRHRDHDLKNHAERSVDTIVIYVFQPKTPPFEDDFSANHFFEYRLDKYPNAWKQQGEFVNFRVNSDTTSFLPFRNDTSWNYFWNSVTSSVDSTPQPSLTLSLYNDFYNPTVPFVTKQVWLPYFRRIYNASGIPIDSIYMPEDSLLFMRFYRITYCTIPPGRTHWIDNKALLNTNYPINPPSLGVATFDGLDSIGMPYNFASPMSRGLADALTSVPFNLDYAPEDSVFFSFFVQPVGLGNEPEPEDSLVLQFQVPGSDWKRAWSINGQGLGVDSSFNRVFIQIKDTALLKEGFRFRFINYATLGGALDHWHIDYVRIDLDADVRISDICWVDPGVSLFSEYSQVPYDQYTSSDVPDQFKNRIRNSAVSSVNVDYALSVTDYGANVYNTLTVGNVDFNPSSINNCNNCAQILNPLIGNSIVLPESTICAKFAVQQVVRNVALEQNRSNDTIIYTQVFGDAFAYDDGTAEAAYGLTSPFGQMAIRYTMLRTDTIKAIRFYFNPVIVDARPLNFTLIIWNEDANGKPGAELYRRSFYYQPNYVQENGGFSDYPIDDATIILSGNFFVGYEQYTSDPLNIGLDRNTNFRQHQYYQTIGIWYQTQFDGSWMIRPVFGSCPFDPLGLEPAPAKSSDALLIYPNPAESLIRLIAPGLDHGQYRILDASGRVVMQGTYNTNDVITLSALSNGLYLVEVIGSNHHSAKGKFFVFND